MNPGVALFFAPLGAPILLTCIMFFMGGGDESNISDLIEALGAWFLAGTVVSYLLTFSIGLFAFAVIERIGFSWLSINMVALAINGIPLAIYWLFTQELSSFFIWTTPFVLANANLFWLLLSMPVNQSKKSDASKTGAAV